MFGENILLIYNSPPALAQLVHAACQCSNLVYGPVRNQDPDLVQLLNRTPSFTGTNKAFSIWKVDSLKALVVSVRGTSCVADHMVNMNAEVVDASRLLVSVIFTTDFFFSYAV